MICSRIRTLVVNWHTRTEFASLVKTTLHRRRSGLYSIKSILSRVCRRSSSPFVNHNCIIHNRSSGCGRDRRLDDIIVNVVQVFAAFFSIQLPLATFGQVSLLVKAFQPLSTETRSAGPLGSCLQLFVEA